MFESILAAYRSAYGRLSREVWALSSALFVNRFGTMVLPFIALYLTDEMEFSEGMAGQLIGIYGLGAIFGAYIGGAWSQSVGPVRLQILLLLLSVPSFLLVPYCTGWWTIAGALWMLAFFSEGVRPANATAIAQYSKPENLTRSFGLQRMALNLGVSFGPIFGGLLATISYFWLFVADAGTTFACALILLYFFERRWATRSAIHRPTNQRTEPSDPLSSPPKDPSNGSRNGGGPSDRSSISESTPPYRDMAFLAYLGLTLLGATVFFQIMATYPMYLRDNYGLSELGIGGLFAINTGLIVVFEMLLVNWVKSFSMIRTVGWGVSLACLGFGILGLGDALWVCVLSMLVLTLGEMLTAPVSSAWVAMRGEGKHQGAYMGWYSMTYSTAFVIGPAVGGWIYQFNRELVWHLCLLASVICLGGFYLLARWIESEHRNSLTNK